MKNISKILCDERSGNIVKKLDSIMTNHLPHIDEKIDKLDTKIDNLEEKVLPLKFIEKIVWTVIGAAIIFIFNYMVMK